HPARPEGHAMVEFTQAADAEHWSRPPSQIPSAAATPAAATPEAPAVARLNAACPHSNFMSLLVTEGHDMFVQTGRANGTNVLEWDAHDKRAYAKHRFRKVKAKTLVEGERRVVKFKAHAASGLITERPPHHVQLLRLDSPAKHTL